MKKLIKKLLFSFLIFNFLFSVGDREEDRVPYTINKSNKSFNNIVGWEKSDGKWKSMKNRIPSWDYKNDKEYHTFGHYNLEEIDFYTVKELPDIVILTVKHLESSKDIMSNEDYPLLRTLIIEKKEIEEKIKFKKDELGIIEIKVYSDFFRNESLTQDEIESKIDKFVYDYIDNNYDFYYRKFCISYYQFKDKIQYLFGEGSLDKSWFDIYSRDDMFLDYIMETKYFESPFDEFESFFKSLLD